MLSGEALLIVESQEGPLKQWDFVHCPPETRHVFVGAGDGPCVILASSSRQFRKDGPWGFYSVDETAARYNASSPKETQDGSVAYAPLACQRRTGSAFGIQARFRSDQVRVGGRSSDYVRTSDEGEERTFHFCPDCGATVFYTLSTVPDVVAVPIGAFAEPAFPPPSVSVYESRRHPRIAVSAAMEHHAD